jgi:adenine nucleotide transporter 17
MSLITAIAGAVSSLLTNPIWMINTRLSISKKNQDSQSTFQLIKDIYKHEGLEAFFKGVIPNLILVINPIINFVIYEALKNIAIKKYGSERNIPFSRIFLMSSAGKIAATYATYPILTLKVKLQAEKTNKQNNQGGFQSIKNILS